MYSIKEVSEKPAFQPTHCDTMKELDCLIDPIHELHSLRQKLQMHKQLSLFSRDVANGFLSWHNCLASFSSIGVPKMV